MNGTLFKKMTGMLAYIVLATNFLFAQTLSGDTTSVWVGDTTDVAIRVTSHENVSLLYYKLSFDKTKLEFIKIDAINPILLPGYVVSIDTSNIANGELWFLAQDTAGSLTTLPNGAMLYSTKFRTLDEAAVVLSAAVMYDTLADSLHVVVDQGYVDVITGTFPLQWLGQNVMCDGLKRIITWSTAQEQNIRFFEVQESNDATDWKKLQEIDAIGGTSQANYELTIPAVMGMRYYRIIAHEHGGLFNTTNVFVKSCGDETKQPQLVPNPMSSYVYVLMNQANSLVVTIYSESGQLLHSYEFYHISDGEVVELKPNLLPGSYMFMINIDGNIITKKIIKTD